MMLAPAPPPLLWPLRSDLQTLAVTGTNGKTTTVSMLAAIVEAAGQIPVRVTSLGAWIGGERVTSETSFDAFVRTVERARAVGARTLALEVTSRALSAGFAARWPPDTAVFTNLTSDHLDLHGTPERYLAAKAQLFLHLPPGGLAVLNVADPASALLAEIVPAGCRIVGYRAGLRSVCPHVPLALAAQRVDCSVQGTRIALEPSALARSLGGQLALTVIGSFNADNALAAAVAAEGSGLPAEAIRHALLAFAGVPGRFEIIARQPLVVVDYAHTPDALERVLGSARALVAAAGGRVGCVFGCGGERDWQKRPMMGAVVEQLADAVWLTTDNPRGEDPEAIAVMIKSGARVRRNWLEIPDRMEAIAAAVRWADARDAVVVAGRGAETTQLLGTGAVHFVDQDAALLALRASGRLDD
jgi:UDP-N-acetylmuramoyl-L-alanyl-D-glutamate--2,6-diaminopimelate ligase